MIICLIFKEYFVAFNFANAYNNALCTDPEEYNKIAIYPNKQLCKQVCHFVMWNSLLIEFNY